MWIKGGVKALPGQLVHLSRSKKDPEKERLTGSKGENITSDGGGKKPSRGKTSRFLPGSFLKNGHKIAAESQS